MASCLTPAEIVNIFKFFDENCTGNNLELLANFCDEFDPSLNIFTVWQEFLHDNFSYEIIEMDVVHFSCPGAELYRGLDHPWTVFPTNPTNSNICDILYMMNQFDDLVNGNF